MSIRGIRATGTKPNLALVNLQPGQLLALVLDNASVGIALLTCDLRYVLASRRTAALAGRERGALIGARCQDVIGVGVGEPEGRCRPASCQPCAGLPAVERREVTTELRRLGQNTILQVRNVPVMSSGSSVFGILQILEDVGDRMTDPLTGVHNYRFFLDISQQEGYRAVRYETALSLLALDIDHFKSVNDRLGHPEGDKVLRGVANVLSRTVRESDHLCRMGGDEFAIIAPQTTYPDASRLGDRIRTAIVKEFRYLELSVAAGIASYPVDTHDPQALREIADRRLYDAKAAGNKSRP